MTNRTRSWGHDYTSSLRLETHSWKELLRNARKKTFRNRWKDLRIYSQRVKSQPQNGGHSLLTLQPLLSLLDHLNQFSVRLWRNSTDLLTLLNKRSDFKPGNMQSWNKAHIRKKLVLCLSQNSGKIFIEGPKQDGSYTNKLSGEERHRQALFELHSMSKAATY